MSRRVLYPDSTRSITVYERYVCQIPVNEYLPHQKDLKTKIPLEDAMKIELRIERTDKLRDAYLNRKLLSQPSAVHFPLNRSPSTEPFRVKFRVDLREMVPLMTWPMEARLRTKLPQ